MNIIPVLCLILLCLAAAPATHPAPRTTVPLDEDWRFTPGDPPNAAAPDFHNAAWSPVRIPHDWKDRAVGWYRRTLDTTPFAGRHLYLEFEAASIAAEVYLDGAKIGQHQGAFAAFRIAIPPTAAPGRHTLAVRISNQHNPDVPSSGDYTTFGGLYRPARLIALHDVCIDPTDHGGPGAYFTTTAADEARALISALVRLRNHSAEPRKTTIRIRLLDPTGQPAADASTALDLAPASAADTTVPLRIDRPRLWNGRPNGHPDAPLYRAVVEVSVGDTLTDRIEQSIGLRTVQLDANRGFLLNGRPYDLRGVNKHQEIGDQVWAVTPQAIDADFAILTEMGSTGVRLVHYQHADYVHSVCDRLGLVTWVESPINARIVNTPAYAANARQQFLELIRQTHNHPAVCMLAIGNEIRLLPGPDPTALIASLIDLARREAPGRVYTIAAKGGNPADKGLSGLGLNTYRGWYGGEPEDFSAGIDQQRANYPGIPLGVSEYGAGASINLHSLTPRRMDYTEEWQSRLHEIHWRAAKERPWLWCKFAWLGFDTSGPRKEADTPGQNNKGLITRDRKTRKDAFYWYQANWSDQPMLYITSRRFTNRTEPKTPVKIYSNAPEVELFINGQSQGILKSPDRLFLWPTITLRPGPNRIEAKAGSGPGALTDSCEWTLR